MKFSRAELQQAVIAFFRPVDSALSLDMSEMVQPVLPLVRGLDTTPYTSLGRPYARCIGTGAPAAGEFGYVAWGPTQNVAFQTTKVIIRSGAVAQNASLKLLTSAELVTAGLTSIAGGLYPVAPLDMSNLASSIALYNGSHTSAVGGLLALVNIAAGSQVIIDLPEPGIILYGQGALPALAVVAGTADEQLEVSIFGRLWAMPL